MVGIIVAYYAVFGCYPLEACSFLSVGGEWVDLRDREGFGRDWGDWREGKLQSGCNI